MKTVMKKLSGLFLAGLLCLGAFGSCTSAEETETVRTDSAGSEDTFFPADTALPRQDRYEFPYLGLSVVLPEELLDRMDQKEMALLGEQSLNEDGTALRCAILSFNTMTKEQREAEIEKSVESYRRWTESLERIGTLCVLCTELEGELDELTRCKEHTKLGESEDGAYSYYLSINSGADEALAQELLQIQAEITEMRMYEEELPASPGDGSITFTTQDVNGETFSEAMFQDYDLTLVNVFATWCSPCIQEIPELEKLYTEMTGQNVSVVGILLDGTDETGAPVQEALDKAKLIAEKTGASYPFLLPDSTWLDGRLLTITAVPYTFFVDQNGTIVGDAYSGSRDFESWKEIVEAQLAALNEEKQ